MIHVTSLRVEFSEQVTTPTILICNINNETIKICSSCKQFSTVQCKQIREYCHIYDEQAQLSFFCTLTHSPYIQKIYNLKEMYTLMYCNLFSYEFCHVLQIHVLCFHVLQFHVLHFHACNLVRQFHVRHFQSIRGDLSAIDRAQDKESPPDRDRSLNHRLLSFLLFCCISKNSKPLPNYQQILLNHSKACQ